MRQTNAHISYLREQIADPEQGGFTRRPRSRAQLLSVCEATLDMHQELIAGPRAKNRKPG